jgi:hypothetical protein
LIAFLVKELFFITFACVWVLLRIVIPVALLPVILLVKFAAAGSSKYQQQKARCTPRKRNEYFPI